LVGKIEILHLSDARVILFKYSGSSELFINQQKAEPGLLYCLQTVALLEETMFHLCTSVKIIGRFISQTNQRLFYREGHFFFIRAKRKGIAPFSFVKNQDILLG
jgi:hypothetical protein